MDETADFRPAGRNQGANGSFDGLPCIAQRLLLQLDAARVLPEHANVINNVR
jgi:hypothetical protein